MKKVTLFTILAAVMLMVSCKKEDILGCDLLWTGLKNNDKASIANSQFTIDNTDTAVAVMQGLKKFEGDFKLVANYTELSAYANTGVVNVRLGDVSASAGTNLALPAKGGCTAYINGESSPASPTPITDAATTAATGTVTVERTGDAVTATVTRGGATATQTGTHAGTLYLNLIVSNAKISFTDVTVTGSSNDWTDEFDCDKSYRSF